MRRTCKDTQVLKGNTGTLQRAGHLVSTISSATWILQIYKLSNAIHPSPVAAVIQLLLHGRQLRPLLL